MIDKFIRWLFTPRASLGYDEHEDDAWKELELRGYAICEHANGKWYCFTDNNVKASDWFVKKSYEERVRHRRAWAIQELARILKLEDEE